MSKKKIKSIYIIGRRWFRRGPGVTYHTAQIIINGLSIHRTPEDSGYGEQYVESAASYLEAQKLIPMRERHSNGSRAALWRHLEELGITFEHTVVDVACERDL